MSAHDAQNAVGTRAAARRRPRPRGEKPAVHEQPLARASLHRQQTGLCRGKPVKLSSPQGNICQDATPALPTRPVQCTPANGAMWLCLTSVNRNAENNEKTCIETPDRAQKVRRVPLHLLSGQRSGPRILFPKAKCAISSQYQASSIVCSSRTESSESCVNSLTKELGDMPPERCVPEFWHGRSVQA